MGFWDSIITFAIVAAAAFYVYRKFAKAKNGGGCGCSSESGCCGGGNGTMPTGCNGTHH